MYIKLNFTQNKTGEQIFRILADIINNAATVTSISALTSRFSSTYTSTEIQAGFDSANSELIVTSPINTSLTRAHVSRLAVADSFQFTLEQSVYDATSTKYYTRVYADRGAGAVGTTNVIPYTNHSTAGVFTCTSTNLAVGDRVTITGTYGGTGTFSGYTSGNTYIVSATTGQTTAVGTSTISGNVLTVTGTPTGTFAVGMILTGSTLIPAGTYITSFGTGTGAAGTYNLSSRLDTAITTGVSLTGTTPTITGFTLVSEALAALTTTAGTATGLTFQAQTPIYATVSDTATSPAFDPALSMAITVASRGASASGTPLTIQNNYLPLNSPAGSNEYTAMQNTCIRTLWCYITDKTFLLGFNGMASTALGWPTATGGNAAYIGSNIFVSQYTRLDSWNSSSNGVVPVIFTKPRAQFVTNYTNYGAGFGSNNYDYIGVWSPNNTGTNQSASICALLLNSYNTYPSATSYNLTKSYNTLAPLGVGLKNTEQQPIQGSSIIDTAAATATTGLSIMTTSTSTTSAGMPNATLTSRTYYLHPLTWMRSDIGAFGGGNISEQSGFYLYNGDYQAGDEFSYSGTTYSIWPVSSAASATSRIGMAVPKV